MLSNNLANNWISISITDESWANSFGAGSIAIDLTVKWCGESSWMSWFTLCQDKRITLRRERKIREEKERLETLRRMEAERKARERAEEQARIEALRLAVEEENRLAKVVSVYVCAVSYLVV